MPVAAARRSSLGATGLRRDAQYECWWAITRLVATDVDLISKVLWGVAILAFPIAGLLAFLLLGERTPQMERELGIRRI